MPSAVRQDCVLDDTQSITATDNSGRITFSHHGEALELQCRVLTSKRVTFEEAVHAVHPHEPPFSRIFLPHSGRASIRCGGQEIPLEPGSFQIVILPPRLLFTADYAQGFTQAYLHVSCTDAFLNPVLEERTEPLTLRDPHLFGMLSEAIQQGNLPMVINGAMMVFVRLLGPDYGGLVRNAARFKDFGGLLNFLRNKHPREHQLENLARLYAITPEALAKRFVRKTGIPLKQFILNNKLSLCVDRLLNTHDTIEEIADQCGFTTSAYFCRFFHQRMHVTPSEFRMNKFKD